MDAYLVNTVHPATLKHALKGHPWITKDSISSKWPKSKSLLQVKISKDKTYTYLHDPDHSFCIARLISEDKISNLKELDLLIQERIKLAFKKRLESGISQQRNHFWLVFAEADYLPGLYINNLNGNLVIQTHIRYWEDHLNSLTQMIKQTCSENKIAVESIWWHQRSSGQHLPLCLMNEKFQKSEKTFWVEEAGVKIKVQLGIRYDYGIYTDMSGIREELAQDPNLLKNKSVLNLFCYTGMFSLWALNQGASYCCSIDSSYKYLEILNENLSQNTLSKEKHKSIESDFFKALLALQDKRNQFDFIIIDPPSSFTTQQKKVQAFQVYPEMLKQIAKIASPKAHILCFLNHHQKTRSQFETMVKASLPQWNLKKQMKLTNDAPLLPYFPEGDYLKGVLLQKK